MKKILKSVATGTLRAIFPFSERMFHVICKNAAERTPLDKPVFVVGPERSGTSLVYSLLANHADLLTLSSMENYFPEHAYSSMSARKLSSIVSGPALFTAVPSTTGAIKGGLFPPDEAILYWKHHLGSRNGGWKNARHDLFTEDDLDDETRRRLPTDLKKRLYLSGKKRFLFKQPGFSLKIRYLNALFPDAIFVHCQRHPLTNFNSLMDRKQVYGNPDWGLTLPPEISLSDHGVEVRAAQQLAASHRIIRESMEQIPHGRDRYVPVRYEALQTDFLPTVEKLFRACELELTHAIRQSHQTLIRVNKRRGKNADAPQDPKAQRILADLCTQMDYQWQPFDEPDTVKT